MREDDYLLPGLQELANVLQDRWELGQGGLVARL